MKLGLVTAICDGMNFEEVVDFAAENGLECLEVACWPQGGAWKSVDGGMLMKRIAGICNAIPFLLAIVLYVIGWVL